MVAFAGSNTPAARATFEPIAHTQQASATDNPAWLDFTATWDRGSNRPAQQPEWIALWSECSSGEQVGHELALVDQHSPVDDNKSHPRAGLHRCLIGCVVDNGSRIEHDDIRVGP